MLSNRRDRQPAYLQKVSAVARQQRGEPLGVRFGYQAVTSPEKAFKGTLVAPKRPADVLATEKRSQSVRGKVDPK